MSVYELFPVGRINTIYQTIGIDMMMVAFRNLKVERKRWVNKIVTFLLLCGWHCDVNKKRIVHFIEGTGIMCACECLCCVCMCANVFLARNSARTFTHQMGKKCAFPNIYISKATIYLLPQPINVYGRRMFYCFSRFLWKYLGHCFITSNHTIIDNDTIKCANRLKYKTTTTSTEITFSSSISSSSWKRTEKKNNIMYILLSLSSEKPVCGYHGYTYTQRVNGNA